MKADEKSDVIIIGAGAAGMFCAALCAGRGRSVLVLDHASRTGSKVRISGGGRCNFTNLNAAAEHYRSRNPNFCKSALARFTPRDMLSLVALHHIAYYEKEAGQMFCRDSAKDIIAMLERECTSAGVVINLDCPVHRIVQEGGFTVTTGKGAFQSRSLVIATGGLSYENLGASSFGHEIARQFGLELVPPRPALVPLLFPGPAQKRFRECAGISLDASVACGGKTYRGNILFTHKGLSGPAVLQASLYWEPNAPVNINLLPDRDIYERFQDKRQSRMAVGNFLGQLLPKRFVQTWLDPSFAAWPITECSNKDLRELADRLHNWKIIPAGTEGYRIAEVTAGGVHTDELSSKTMEAKKVPGLYFIGEVMDVTGELGGYNLHWAWASAHAAGEYA
ncbi:MAG: NAD(P)/FAD-dependent oxidoreductase [Nitrospirota bacterium]|nr:NAD(P)/FAD-dependent oxidoreductase [Nitrospirota bacterium]